MSKYRKRWGICLSWWGHTIIVPIFAVGLSCWLGEAKDA